MGWEDEEDIDYENRPDLAPPNSTWNEDSGGWDTTKPTDKGYDPTWGGYVDPNNPNDPHSGWLDSVYDAQGWGPRHGTANTNTPPSGPTGPTRPGSPPTGTGTGPGGGANPRINSLRDQAQAARGNTAAQDRIARQLADLLAEQGHSVKWKGQDIIIDGRAYVIGGDDPSKEWTPAGKSTYTPGTIGTEDIPEFSFESLMSMMATPEMDAFMSSLLANPESMNALTVDRMKAASKDELAEMDVENQQDLDTLASTYGIQESPWVGAQKLDSRRSRDNALVQSNRAIDMEAAHTNMADRRAAAGLGLTHAQNKQSKVMAAASTALQRSAAIGDRLALRETVNQKAAELNIRAEELLASHIQHRLDNMTEMYGIDVRSADTRYSTKLEAASRLSISADELAMADRHFLEELAFKMEELDALERERRRKQIQWDEEHALNLRRQDWVETLDDKEDD